MAKKFLVSDLFTADENEAGAWLTVKGKDGKPSPLRLHLKGVDSPSHKQALRDQQKRFFESKDVDETVQMEDFVVDMLVSLTIGWKSVNEKGGKLAMEEFTPELCKELYTKAPYVRKQVDEFIEDRTNFTSAKPTK